MNYDKKRKRQSGRQRRNEPQYKIWFDECVDDNPDLPAGFVRATLESKNASRSLAEPFYLK